MKPLGSAMAVFLACACDVLEPCVIGRHSSRNDTSHLPRAQSGRQRFLPGCLPGSFRGCSAGCPADSRAGADGQLMARTNDTVAAAEATVRTWFHAVHSRTYVGQYAAASAVPASSLTSASLRGTFATIV